MFILMITASIYFMSLDELMMSSAQSSMGPLNLGWYGILTAMINGCNLIMTQLMIPMLHFYFGFQLFPMFFYVFSLIIYSIMYPYSLINLMLSLVLMIMISDMSILFIILSAWSCNSKYSMLGCISLISQLMPLELMWTTIITLFIWTFNEISIVGFMLVYSLLLL